MKQIRKRKQPRLLYTTKLPFKGAEEIKTSTNKEKLMQFIASRPAWQDLLKEFLQKQRKWHRSETYISNKQEKILKEISRGKMKTYVLIFYRSKDNISYEIIPATICFNNYTLYIWMAWIKVMIQRIRMRNY